jgi:hypothetical protein
VFHFPRFWIGAWVINGMAWLKQHRLRAAAEYLNSLFDHFLFWLSPSLSLFRTPSLSGSVSHWLIAGFLCCSTSSSVRALPIDMGWGVGAATGNGLIIIIIIVNFRQVIPCFSSV